MPLLTARELSLAFGLTPLLDKVNFSLDKGERVAVIGRNGEGKSTLLRVLNGGVHADSGEVVTFSGLRIAELPQEVPQDLQGTVLDVVLGGAGALADALVKYHHTDPMSAEFSRLHELIDRENGWELDQRALREIKRMELEPEADFAALSGGSKRRALLARAWLSKPDILLLDEPTNHLDVRTIDWLENELLQFSGTLVFITHDRAFLQKLATRIFELDRGVLRDFPGDLQNYLRRKQEILHAEEKQNSDFDKKLAIEETWIRQGIKARRTRNEGRVRALIDMRRERTQRRERKGNVNLALQQGDRSGKRVIETRELHFRWNLSDDDTTVVRELSTLIERGDKLAIIGDNGVGKTTLLRLLLGQLQPTSGEVELGTQLDIAYFDQLRNVLDENASVLDNVADGAEFIDFNGERRHVLGYLQDFLFAPARARTPVKALSGGERNRLLLAKLFTKPCNLLVLDEPTNDLDVETLELLEELLISYSGTLILISHDRQFIDNIATSVLAFEGDGEVREYVGGYSDWLRQRPAQRSVSTGHKKPEPEKPVVTAPSASEPKKRKLSYNEQRELDQLPAKIEQMEAEQVTLQTSLADPALFKQSPAEALKVTEKLAALEAALASAYARWESLDSGV